MYPAKASPSIAHLITQTYLTLDAARQDVFDYIEMFYNPTRKHTNNGMLSPVDYEMNQQKMSEAGV